MSPAGWCAIALLGGAGAVARFLVDAAVSARVGRRFPWGILAVNVAGAFALGVLAGAALGGDAMRLAGTGLLGAFTTFSTWALDSQRLGAAGRPRLGAANVGVALALGITAAWLGREIGAAL